MAEGVPPPIPADAAVGALLAGRVDTHRVSRGMVVAVTEGGTHRVVAHGEAGGPGVRPVDAGTLFEIGSITKVFTALLLADMIGTGEVERDQPVADLLPTGVRVPARNGVAITLGHLATHRSGLPRVPGNLGWRHQTDPGSPYTPDLLYAWLADHELARTPGDVADYSNLGFGLLGHALSRLAGTSYEALVRSRILARLGMGRTTVAVPPDLADAVATGHDDALDPMPAWRFGALDGAGALRSCAADMLRALDALREPARSPVAAAVATLTRPPSEGGLGFGTPHPDAGTLLSHVGGTGGFRAYLGCLPAWDRGVVVLSNASVEAAADLGMHLLDARCGLLRFPTEVPVDPRVFAGLAGRYRLMPDQVFDVSVSGDRLLVGLTGQKAYRVFPSSDLTFFYRGVGAQLTFEPDGDGRAARVILHQNGVDRVAERIG